MLRGYRAHPRAARARFISAIFNRTAGAVFRLFGAKVNIHHNVSTCLGIKCRGTSAGAIARSIKWEAKGEPAHATCIAAPIRRCGRPLRAREGVARSHGIVSSALLLVGQDRISLGDLFEFLLGVGLFVDIGMKLARFELKSLLNFFRRGVFGYAQDSVIVFFVHRSHRGLPF